MPLNLTEQEEFELLSLERERNQSSTEQPQSTMQKVGENISNIANAEPIPAIGNIKRNLIEGVGNDVSNISQAFPKAQPYLKYPLAAAGAVAQTAYDMVPTTNKDIAINALGGAAFSKAGQAMGKLETMLTPKTPLEKAGKLSDEATAIYRKILNPGKGELKTIEVIGGKDINDSIKLATEAKIPIGKMENNKLDTNEAMDIIKTKLEDVHSKLDKVLIKDKTIYNLNDLKATAREALKSKYKNAADYEDAVKETDNMVDAEIRRYGEKVSSKQLNDIKQGMWSVGYNAMKPTASKTARTIGMLAKDALQERIPNSVKALNELSGRYATLNGLLENAHGRVIAGGKIGNYVGKTVGGMVGLSTRVPVVGPAVGQWVGGKITSEMTNPERLSNIAISKAEKAQKFLQKIRKP